MSIFTLNAHVYHLFLEFLSDVHLMSEEEFFNLSDEDQEVYFGDFIGRLRY